MQFNPIQTELTTAATDVALGVLAVGCAGYLIRVREHDRWKVRLWGCVFGMLAAAALLGAVAHGFVWSSAVWDLFWFPLFLLLGLTVALFVVGAIYDWRGLPADQKAVPARLMEVMGRVYTELGAFDQAQPLPRADYARCGSGSADGGRDEHQVRARPAAPDRCQQIV